VLGPAPFAPACDTHYYFRARPHNLHRTISNGRQLALGRCSASANRRVALLELVTPVLARALDPFPIPVRTLDALHLASIEFLRVRQQQVELASYDARLIAVARALQIPLYDV
jgi:hypothetical protein